MWKKILFAIGAGLVLTLALTKLVQVLIHLEPIDPRNISVCRNEKNAKEESFKGKLIDKYRDKQNHNYEMIKIRFGDDDEYESKIFILEESGVFNSLRIGDSLFKEAGSLQMTLKRADQISVVDLVYDCKDSDEF